MNAGLLSLSEEDIQPLCLDHVEAPVRRRKPGVVEAEWLNILFGEGE